MRKIIQISAIPCGDAGTVNNMVCVYVLCDDYSIWKLVSPSTEWVQLPNIPQDNLPNVTQIECQSCHGLNGHHSSICF